MVDAAVNFTAKKARRFEDSEMFGDGGEGNVKWLGEFLDRGFALGEAGENGATCGVGKSAEGGIERGDGIVNHVVYYYRWTGFCQAVFRLESIPIVREQD
jgi:hypothetical protein